MIIIVCEAQEDVRLGRFTIRRLRLHCRIVAKATSIVHRKSLNRKYTDGKSQNKGYRQDGRCIRGNRRPCDSRA